MTPSSLSSTHHGHVHITFRRFRNWTTHPLHLLLPRHHSLPLRPLPLSRARWDPNTSPGKLFPIKPNSSRTLLHPRKRTCLVKRSRTAPLHSEFFGRCNYHEHSGTHHHHHQHHHHVTSHKYLRRVLHSRGDVSCSRRSRHSPLHKSTFRSYSIVSFIICFFLLLFLTTVRIY